MSEINTNVNKRTRGRINDVFDWIHIFFIAIILAGLLNCFVFQLIKIEQTSMVPTFMSGEKVLLSKASLWFNTPQCGDIIVFLDESKNENLIKRVIGVPGDTIEIKNNAIYRNGTKLNEPYINGTMNTRLYIVTGQDSDGHDIISTSITVPEGTYFCLGDNRNVSRDSREIGCIPLEKILGKVIFRFNGMKAVSSFDHSYADK